ncbi:hypothetical protein B0T22DRAFT_455517 [Podospora appendiculata]|uniref:Kinetochore protein Sos7 coiled-coil domain-containing protein n=1 Tax=Podospora appendiculata TaxID=314037 RepID=A0AAE0XLI8_9PEZI|nr:hypothetical protein B0T22DRAFT_455517 [Podospora appendiculata]
MARPPSPSKPTPATTTAAARKVLRTLADLTSEHEITIIKISEPIATAQGTVGTNPALGRTSDISTASLDSPTPASLEADLAHYRELFAKLRFSYVEQVTKEKFIRAIVGDPPLIVTPQENAELEAENAAAKAALKALKTEVIDMVADLEARGRRLAARHENITLETAILADLPAKVEELEQQNAALRRAARLVNGEEENEEANGNDSQSGEGMKKKAGLNLPLAKTVALVEERRVRARELDRELEQLSSVVPRKRKEGERLRSETAALETKRANSTAAAREARRRRENAQGGVEDDLEAKGRWYRATETALRQMLDVKE